MKHYIFAGLAAVLVAGGHDLHPWGLAFNDPPTHIDD
jgi:hypothetical protein